MTPRGGTCAAATNGFEVVRRLQSAFDLSRDVGTDRVCGSTLLAANRVKRGNEDHG